MENDNNIIPFIKEEVFLARVHIVKQENLSVAKIYVIEMERNKPYVSDELLLLIKKLAEDIFNIMPSDVKEIYFKEKMNLIAFKIKIKGDMFKAYVSASEIIYSEYEIEIQTLLKKLENYFQTVV